MHQKIQTPLTQNPSCWLLRLILEPEAAAYFYFLYVQRDRSLEAKARQMANRPMRVLAVFYVQRRLYRRWNPVSIVLGRFHELVRAQLLQVNVLVDGSSLTPLGKKEKMGIYLNSGVSLWRSSAAAYWGNEKLQIPQSKNPFGHDVIFPLVSSRKKNSRVNERAPLTRWFLLPTFTPHPLPHKHTSRRLSHKKKIFRAKLFVVHSRFKRIPFFVGIFLISSKLPYEQNSASNFPR